MSSVTERRHPINVRALAEFAMEHGDLSPVMALTDRMIEGAKGHRALQKGYAAGYSSEVPIKLEAEVDGVWLLIQGRMDGLDLSSDIPLVDEIKTTQGDPLSIGEHSHPEHWAQAEIYAHMVCETRGKGRARVRLSYYNLDGRLNIYEHEHSAAELRALFESYARPYAAWLKAVEAWRAKSLPTIEALAFPFDEFRGGQREMAANVYVALRDRKNLLCQAPTGIGKTAAALFPAVKALGEGLIERVFYLTARTTTRQVAEATVERMRAQGLALRSLTLTAKEKLCLYPGERCSPELCERARGYYDRRRAALLQGLTIESLTREAVESLAEEHQLCPFELSLDLAEISDVVICDYNHAFDPKVKLKRFFMDGGDYALLVDEAHNLIDRSREMLSATLRQRDFEALRREAGKVLGRKSALYKALTDLISAFKALREQYDEPAMELEPPESLTGPLMAFADQAAERLAEGLPFTGALIDAYFCALDYRRALDAYDSSYRALLMPAGKAVEVRLWCYDASGYLRGCMDKVHGTILFSATLSPMHYYLGALGLDEGRGDALLDLPSPFPPENLLVLGLPLPTRYRQRQASAPEVARAILLMCRAKPGNYLACFPSHAYLHQVRPHLEAAGDVRLLIQRANMDDRERAEFLARFEPGPQDSMLALVAMGGIFAEGIDLPGELLSGAAIVGVGIPQVGFERERLRELYDDRADEGYHYAYTYPGIERVLQAAGRVIRTETDRGVVLLIDDRFQLPGYRVLLPAHWRVQTLGKTQALQDILRDFWLQ